MGQRKASEHWQVSRTATILCQSLEQNLRHFQHPWKSHWLLWLSFSLFSSYPKKLPRKFLIFTYTYFVGSFPGAFMSQCYITNIKRLKILTGRRQISWLDYLIWERILFLNRKRDISKGTWNLKRSFALCKVIQIQESRKFLLVESGILCIGIQNPAFGIQNPAKKWI